MICRACPYKTSQGGIKLKFGTSNLKQSVHTTLKTLPSVSYWTRWLYIVTGQWHYSHCWQLPAAWWLNIHLINCVVTLLLPGNNWDCTVIEQSLCSNCALQDGKRVVLCITGLCLHAEVYNNSSTTWEKLSCMSTQKLVLRGGKLTNDTLDTPRSFFNAV